MFDKPTFFCGATPTPEPDSQVNLKEAEIEPAGSVVQHPGSGQAIEGSGGAGRQVRGQIETVVPRQQPDGPQFLHPADGLPVLLENIFLPYMEYRELMEAELTDCSIFGAIERIGGRKVEALARRTLEITRASAEEARLLAVPAGEPLFYLNAYFTDREQRPVCIGRQYYVGSRYLFEI